MKADDELIKYIEEQRLSAKNMMDDSALHGDQTFKHIYASGRESAFRELLLLRCADKTDKKDL